MFGYGAYDTEVSCQPDVREQGAKRNRAWLRDQGISLQASDLVNLKVLPSFRQP